jgi:hypothetical protein
MCFIRVSGRFLADVFGERSDASFQAINNVSERLSQRRFTLVRAPWLT